MTRSVLFMALGMLAVACNGGLDGDLTDAAKQALLVCEEYCDACSEADTCADICFDQWAVYGGGPQPECGDTYLIGTYCQVEHECGDPACGDPFADASRCVRLME